MTHLNSNLYSEFTETDHSPHETEKRETHAIIFIVLYGTGFVVSPNEILTTSSYVTVRHKLCWSVQAGVFQPATCFFPALGDKFKYYDLDIRLGGTTYLENSSIIVMDGFVTFAVYSHCCRNIVTDQ